MDYHHQSSKLNDEEVDLLLRLYIDIAMEVGQLYSVGFMLFLYVPENCYVKKQLVCGCGF